MAEEHRELDAQEDENELDARSTVEESSRASSGRGKLEARDDFDEEIDDADQEANVPISELRKVRAEAAKYRKRLRQLESQVEKNRKEAELAKMKETDRLKAIAEEAEAKAESLRIRADSIAKRAAIINTASSLDFFNPKDAASMIDLDRIDVDDEGNVDAEKVNEMVKSLAKSKPYLIKKQDDSQEMADFGPTNPASSNWPKPKFRTKDQIFRLKQQSDEAIRNGRIAKAIKLYNQAWEQERGARKKKERGG